LTPVQPNGSKPYENTHFDKKRTYFMVAPNLHAQLIIRIFVLDMNNELIKPYFSVMMLL